MVRFNRLDTDGLLGEYPLDGNNRQNGTSEGHKTIIISSGGRGPIRITLRNPNGDSSAYLVDQAGVPHQQLASA